MVASSGMIEIAWNSPPADRTRYLAFVKSVLNTVLTPAYQFTPQQALGAVLKNGTTTYPQTGVPIIYGTCARINHSFVVLCDDQSL